MSLGELIKILERDTIADFSEVGKKWEEVVKETKNRPDERKRLKSKLEDITGKKIELIKREKLKFLDSDPNRVLTTALLIAGYSRFNNLKRSQIRKILDIMQNTKKKGIQNRKKKGESGEVSPELLKKEEVVLKREVARVRYLLAYASRNSSVKPLQHALEPLLAEIRTYEDFEKVYEFFQSIVAFHYFLGGD